MSVRSFLFALMLSGCGGYDAGSGTCQRDEDCKNGARCVVGTGVCVRFPEPDASVGDLAAVDQAAPADAAGGD